jgi:two-component system, OmpR family, KDP operon response regulator KdpE
VTILDLGLPDVDGMEVCRHLRRSSRNPIIVVTADGAEGRKVQALTKGDGTPAALRTHVTKLR